MLSCLSLFVTALTLIFRATAIATGEVAMGPAPSKNANLCCWWWWAFSTVENKSLELECRVESFRINDLSQIESFLLRFESIRVFPTFVVSVWFPVTFLIIAIDSFNIAEYI